MIANLTMKPKIAYGLLLICALAVFGGCALGPNYKRPAVQNPPNFRFAQTETTNSLAELPWWQVFHDPILQGLISTALTNNYDLKQAVARVEQSRQLAVAARAPLFPQVGYNGEVGWQVDGEPVPPPVGSGFVEPLDDSGL